ncbi:MAG: SusC/RagA family TonB-linked outer membrane protein, partial [Gemmatimonadetes bacterium]|nr:SusC/RagA family TonB-linked outer membrane protein [Gemmatimonadota bacterium]
MPVCNAETGIIVPGVKVVRGDTVPNDIVLSAQQYWTSFGVFGTTESNLFDASYVKLREVTLGYELPVSLTNRLRISGLQLGLTGRNLKLWTDAPHIDPETAFDASNVQGLEFGQIPTPRSIGLNVSIQP